MAASGPLRILFVEDVHSDAELAARTLRRSGLEFSSERVGTLPALRDALKKRCPDLIVSDLALPDFSGMEALSLSIAHDPQLPFIFLTGSSDEDTAAACFKAGAWCFVLKENPSQLPFAVRDALALKRALVDAATAREALQESERRYRTLADAGRALIWTSGPDGKRQEVNQPWLTFTGRAAEQDLGDGWSELVHPDDLSRCLDAYATGVGRRAPFCVVYRLRRHDGEYRTIDEQGTPRYDTRETFLGYVGQGLDMTDLLHAEQERRGLEAGLAPTQKTEGAGRLADSVAHDLNNLLTGILGFCDLLLTSMPPDSPYRADVLQIQAVAQRASPLARQLRA